MDKKTKKREYYLKNRDKIIAQNKSYYEVNKEKIKAKRKEYLIQNKEKIADKKGSITKEIKQPFFLARKNGVKKIVKH